MSFKVGDWVRDTRQGMKNPIVQLKPNCLALTNPQMYSKQYVLWQPQVGGFCWALGLNNFPVLVQFTGEIFKDQFKYKTVSGAIWLRIDEVEPFIGNLPSFLKGNK